MTREPVPTTPPAETARNRSSPAGHDVERWAEPIALRGLSLPNRLILAPLAGVSDVPFRRLCAEMGAGLTFVEMLSATALRYRARRTLAMLDRHAEEPRVGVQLTGGSPEDIGEAVSFLDAQGFDVIDINMGCPVRKIVRKGWGSALLQNPGLVRDIVLRARSITPLPLSVKIRIGYTPDAINVTETARLIAGAGADMITIHGRTRSDRYSSPVRYDRIREGFRAAGDERVAPVCVGNGNVLDRDTALTMLRETDCDAVMISRGALGNPWIFEELLGRRSQDPTIEEWLDGVLRHLDYHEQYYGKDRMSAVRARKFLIWYMSGFRGSKSVRDLLSVVESIGEARDLFRRFAQSQPPGILRYHAEARHPQEHDPAGAMDSELDRAAAEEGLEEAS